MGVKVFLYADIMVDLFFLYGVLIVIVKGIEALPLLYFCFTTVVLREDCS
jgi:hypothetical protein